MKKIILCILLPILCSCASKSIALKDQTLNIDDKATLQALKIKQKKKKFALSMIGTSSSKTPLLVKKEDISCGKGSLSGVLKHMKGGPNLILKPGTSQEYKLVCNVQTDVEGDYFVNFAKVYETKGKSNKVIQKDLKWILK